MDQISQKSKDQMCSKHSKKAIEFLQVSNLQNTQNNQLFYCTSCINQDLSFKGLDYLLTSQIIEEGQTNIIQKWPPINDYSVLDKLIEFTNNQDSSSSIIHQINSYFTQLKEEFLRKVDLCEKKMINSALELPLGKESILNQYQQISSITKLRTLLIEGQNKDREAHEQNCRKFISEIQRQKEKNSELLLKLSQQCEKKEELVDFKYPNLIKDSIFSFIDSIDFFNSSNKKIILNNPSNQATATITSNSSKIMKLISNKSNFCTTEFLASLQTQLEKLNPLLSQLSFENIYQKNKNPLDFSALNQQKLDIIEDFVNHQIQQQKNQQHSETIKKTIEYQHLDKIIESSVSFLNNNLKEQLKKYIIDSYPLLKQVNFTNAILDNGIFDCFRSLTSIEIQDLFIVTQQRRLLVGDNEYNQSQTKVIKDKNQNNLSCFENADEIFRKYPIFDLMKKKKQQPLEVKLTKTNWQNGNEKIVISNNNQLSLNINSATTINCVSDIILEKENKYIFRFSIQSQEGHYFIIGLMQNSECNSNCGYNNYLSCQFYQENNQIQYYADYGIGKHVKGDKLRLSQENEIEMRVWLGRQQLEILDYPNYQYKVAIKDQYKNRLVEQNDLKLYLAIFQQKINIILKSSEIVDNFPN